MRNLMLLLPLLLVLLGAGADTPGDNLFDDPMFRRCLHWMLDGKGGALIDNICEDEYQIPPPSLFLCARKVKEGFPSLADRELCAAIFEEQAVKARAGFIR
jgi:hypothetical protein